MSTLSERPDFSAVTRCSMPSRATDGTLIIGTAYLQVVATRR